MNSAELEQFIRDSYGTEPDYPWIKHPGYRVFRHSGNQKWFALIMGVPRDKLGLRGTAILEVANLKCPPALIGSLLNERGFFPGYHMSKASWITAALDGSAADETIRILLDMSYEATAPRKKRT